MHHRRQAMHIGSARRASEVSVDETGEPGGRFRPPWFVSFLGRRLVWALVTLIIFLTAVFFFVQVWVPYTWATQFLPGRRRRLRGRAGGRRA